MFEWLKRFLKATKAAVSPRDAIILSVAFLLGAILLPIGIGEVANANVVNWDASVQTIFQILFPILGVVGLAMYFIPRFTGAG